MKRNAIGIMYAIFVMLVIAGIATYSLSISAQTTKVAVDEHIKIQLQLYKKSAIELGLLWLSGEQTRSNPTNGTGGSSDYNISFDGQYHFSMRFWETDTDSIVESNGTVIMDLTGYTDVLDEPIRITERRILKP